MTKFKAPKEGTSQFDPFVHEKESFRPLKIANRIKEELLLLIPDSLKDPRIQKYNAITITNVICTPDLRNARVHFAMFENADRFKEVEKILNDAAGFLRREVHVKLGIKYTPLLTFHFDKGLAHATRIHNILTDDSAEAHTDEDEL